MKKLILFTCAFGVLSLTCHASFTDLSENHPYFEAVNFVEQKEIVHGYPEGSYKPDITINRAEFTKIIISAYFSEEEINNCEFAGNFSDINLDEWYMPYICVAYNEGIIHGYPDGTFKPENEINFAEASKIIANGTGAYLPENEIWYEPYVEFLELREARPSSVAFNDQFITRGEMAEIIFQLRKYQLSDEDKLLLSEYAFSYLDSQFGIESELPKLNDLYNFEKIVVTFMNGNEKRCCMSGGTTAFIENRTESELQYAVKNCINDDRYGSVIKEEELQDLDIVFNILYNKRELEGTYAQYKMDIEFGVHAIELKNGSKSAYFKESVPIEQNYDLITTFTELCKKANLDEECYNDPNTKVSIYDTLTFKVDRDLNLTDLYRYNLLLDFDEIDNEVLNKRLDMTESWFLNNIDPETGRLEYMYQPSSDSYSTENNHIRHLAVLWALTEFRNYLGNSSLDELITNTFDYYLKFAECDGDICYLNVNNSSTIAHNGFMIMALVNFDTYPERDAWLVKFSDAIVSMQNEDGSYNTNFISDNHWGEDFFPGEAVLSLMMMYDYSGDEKYLNSVKEAFYYYRDYWRIHQNTAFIPWHTQAYFILYNYTRDQEVADFIFEMNDWLLFNRQITDSIYTDKIGGMPSYDPQCSTYVYMEGLNVAYTLAKELDDEKHMTKYRDSIRIGLRFMLSSQLTPEGSFYFDNPERAIGGFTYSLTNNEQRIDHTQHSLMALIKTINNDIFPIN